MTCCTPRCKKWSTFAVAGVLLVMGILMATCFTLVFTHIKNRQLSLANANTIGYKMWKETPIPMYMQFYLFNWTNYEEFKDGAWPLGALPKFEQCGPYTYKEHHVREEVVFNDNQTLTYKTKKTWRFVPDKSNGSLSDNITNINVILAAVGDLVKDKNIIVREGINFFINEKKEPLFITKTAEELLFTGYDDELIRLAKKLHIKGLDLPFDKFGWFYQRNNSADYDGVFNMYTGANDIRQLGRFHAWNYNHTLNYYPGDCGIVRGTSGELWYPIEDDTTITVFHPDVCSTVSLVRGESIVHNGIEGYYYEGTKDLFDNGDKIEANKCYMPAGKHYPSGIRSVQKCKFNAPAYVSYPHFYMADPSYSANIVGMKPDPVEHRFQIGLEPKTGMPLKVHAALQVNIYIQNIKGIDLFANLKPTYVPALWFKQTAELSEDLSNEAKLLLILPSIGNYTGYGLIGLGVFVALIGGLITVKKGWKVHDEEQLLNENRL